MKTFINVCIPTNAFPQIDSLQHDGISVRKTVNRFLAPGYIIKIRICPEYFRIHWTVSLQEVMVIKFIGELFKFVLKNYIILFP